MRPSFMRAAYLGAAGFIAAGAALASLASEAEAAFALRLDDGNDGIAEVTIMDNGAGDLQGAAGAIIFSGPIGIWNVNLTLSFSGDPNAAIPTLPGPFPHISVDTTHINSGPPAAGGESLAIIVTDTGFDSDQLTSQFRTTFNGMTSGKVQFETWVNTDNTMFSTAGDRVTNIGPIEAGPGAFQPFAGADRGVAAVDDEFGVTMKVTIMHDQPGDTSDFNASFQIPVPGTLTLLGIGLIGLGGLAVGSRRGRVRQTR